ncbi:MAG: sigma 54-interacting transcriptional regulator [Candidatus Omnitrophota bacterium]|jgi:Nif-specific regulatory protein
MTTMDREVQEVSLLFEISQTLNSSNDIHAVINPILKVMAERMGMLHGTLTIFNRKTGEIFIENAFGLSPQERLRGRYKIGEGVTGRVVQSGKPMIVPKVSEEPQFLNRTKAREKLKKNDISFICVPIKIDNKVVGALSADRLFAVNISLQEDVRLLTIIASLIAQSVKLHQEVIERQQQLEEENARLQNQLQDTFRPANIIGNSGAIREVFKMVSLVLPTDTTVFIRGESGVGKELIAGAIHYNSSRAKQPFIKVNCAALPESLIESELFGHEKGTFTGAIAQRQGRFELAQGGTLFLDEVGDLPVSAQIKLLRVIQEKEFERLGGNKPIKVDVRLITATNRNIEQLIKDGTFRTDLYYRLNVFPIYVPALRERKTDIILLADYFIEKYSKKMNKTVKRLAPSATDLLMAYHWPGNVRELENVIERAVLLSGDGAIHAHHLPPSLQIAETSKIPSGQILEATLERVEKDMIIDALKSTKGNCTKAARQLGLTDRILGLRIQKYTLDPKQFKNLKNSS